ncbi:MAG: tRNA (adenosine(37)-N6)-threonylcarbamoyltransferase complex ATPase subunit type 1 TsaE [Elusimicrobia bacterium]|nr:tRNA (adenosine(37)-N6)-threonylcarbamoyltransferase complex ATPase subunit type 1 TsaE [Elusimicrobiota bacterium]
MNIFKSSSAADTGRLAGCLARSGARGSIIFLSGPIGSGKTVFVQGLARALGLSDIPSSASFAIARSYRGAGASLYHFDLFRLKADEMRECGYEEALQDADGVIAVEWPAPALEYFPQDRLELDFELLPDGGRRIRARAGGAQSSQLLEKAARLWLKKTK